jgi:hypothetical protein
MHSLLYYSSYNQMDLENKLQALESGLTETQKNTYRPNIERIQHYINALMIKNKPPPTLVRNTFEPTPMFPQQPTYQKVNSVKDSVFRDKNVPKDESKDESKDKSKDNIRDLVTNFASEYVVNRNQPINLTALGNAGAGLIANRGVTYLAEKAHVDKGISKDIGSAIGGGITGALTKATALEAIEAGSALAAPETLGASFAAGSLLAGAIELGSHLLSSGKL